jgi:hypothetical protein
MADTALALKIAFQAEDRGAGFPGNQTDGIGERPLAAVPGKPLAIDAEDRPSGHHLLMVDIGLVGH